MDGDGPPAKPPAKPPVRCRIVRRTARRPNANAIPDDILNDQNLARAISKLPRSYNFEIPKTIHRLRTTTSKSVSLQMPEGLLIYGPVLVDIFKSFTSVKSVVIQGDVTYGACCVDDLGALSMGCDYLVHYGHSCLVPLTTTVLPCLYVFVEITIDPKHAAECFMETIKAPAKVNVMGTVQFRDAIFSVRKMLTDTGYTVVVPQAKPLSPGEVLGCTSPKGLYDESLGEGEQCILFIADGRFHLEAAMIANPSLSAYRYDPYSKTLTLECYDFPLMTSIREKAIKEADDANTFGVILGTLGRQGNPSILRNILTLLHSLKKSTFVVLLSEITPEKLDMMPQADAWVQVACPRLSIDWGHYFNKPILSPYEVYRMAGEVQVKEGEYEMDFYMKGEENYWSNFGGNNAKRECR